MEIPKLIKDGKVAVLYSPGYGAGWSTWAGEHSEILTYHRDIAQCVLDGNLTEAAVVAEKIIREQVGEDAYVCVLGSNDLEIEWLPVGTIFRITEYDGSESVECFSLGAYLTA